MDQERRMDIDLQHLPSSMQNLEATCIQAIQLFERHCEHERKRPTQRNYIIYCHSNKNAPSLQVINGLFSSWNKARLCASEGEDIIRLNSPGQRRVWVEELCLEAIRQYEEFCQKTGKGVSRDGYQVWHEQTPGTPSIHPIEQMGSWNNMRLRAMQDPSQVHINRLHQEKWSKNACLQAVRQYKKHCQILGKQCTGAGYIRWHTRHPDTPSKGTLMKLGDWKTVLNRAEEGLYMSNEETEEAQGIDSNQEEHR